MKHRSSHTERIENYSKKTLGPGKNDPVYHDCCTGAGFIQDNVSIHHQIIE